MHVRVEAENRRALGRVVGAHALEHARPVVEPVRGDMYLRGIPWYQLSVRPDEF
ncbi:hypothetical protein D3C83_334290 [compost metagenome]